MALPWLADRSVVELFSGGCLGGSSKTGTSSRQLQSVQGPSWFSGRFPTDFPEGKVTWMLFFLFCFVFSEISDNTSEMDEGKRPQEPPSAPPRITHGKGEGSQVSQCIIRNPSLELLYSASVFLSCLFIIAAPESPSRYFFLIMNTTPQGILITQVYCISISVLDIFIYALYMKRVKFFHPKNQLGATHHC